MAPNYINQDQKPATKTKNHHRHKSTAKNKLKTVTSQKLVRKDEIKPMKKKETKEAK